MSLTHLVSLQTEAVKEMLLFMPKEIQITNTPNIDECYPSVSNWNKGSSGVSYDLNITYMKDPGVGPTSFGGSAAQFDPGGLVA